jgi:hypothetical protein
MKRLGIFASLLILLFSTPLMMPARGGDLTPATMALDELPWSTVSAVFQRVEQETEYIYSQLVEWFQVALCMVEYIDSDYVVKIYDEDGLTDSIIIDSL